ncbi:MAG: LysM peptidoglycan-binding domain-containing protein [Caldilineaceae bacterium]
MNRRQLAFIVTLNAVVSLAIAILVNWVAELRRPDPEELAAFLTPVPQAIIAATPAVNIPSAAQTEPTPVQSAPQLEATPTSSGPVLTGNEAVYTVQAGDSLSSIAGRFNVTVNELMAANRLDNPDFVFVGQQLVVPGSSVNSQPAQNNAGSAPPTATPAQQGVVIAELAGAGNSATESLLLVNESNNAVDMRGWTLGREGGAVYTFGGVNLFPGSSVRLHTGVGESNSVELYWGREEAAWPSGSVVRLVNVRGELVNSYSVP